MPDRNGVGFVETWNPALLVVVACVLAAYFWLTGPYAKRRHPDAPVGFGRKIAFVFACLLFTGIYAGPPHLLEHAMFSVHMAGMAIAFLVFPPVLLAGLPTWMLRSFANLKGVRPWLYRLTGPLLSLFLFNAAFSLYHIPDIMDAVMMSGFLHLLAELILYVTAIAMWWNILGPLPEWERLTDVKKMGYIFANGVLLTPACALIIFADHPLYAMFSSMSGMHEGAQPAMDALMRSKVQDQQLGGIIMKLTQEAMYGAMLFVVFVRWFRRENPRGDAVDPIPETAREQLEWNGNSSPHRV